MAEWLDLIADVAMTRPFEGSLPATAGLFAVNTSPADPGNDPGDRYLGRRLAEAIDKAWEPVDGNALLVTYIPPFETDPNVLANEEGVNRELDPIRVTAGGLDALLSASLFNGLKLVNEREAELEALATAMNKTPFFGQVP